MASTIPALRGQFGSFEYWVTTMHVGELIEKITIPKDMDGWSSLSIEERYQRDINITRVKKEIAPYFANDDDRFTGALIIAVNNDDEMAFEPLSDIGSSTQKMPKLYKSAAASIGFLTFSGKELFVPLDGQHRVKALQFAVRGTDDIGNGITNVKTNTALATEAVAVILVRFDPEKSRRIFSKVNRYAKPTTRGQNLITDDDDAVAIATRHLIGNTGLIPAELVRWQSNTLSAKAPEFTTLSTLYDANMAIIEQGVWSGAGSPKSANEEQRQLFEDELETIWALLVEGVELFKSALHDPTESGNDLRMEIREQTLLGKPIGQLCLVKAFLEMRQRCDGTTDAELLRRLNQIPWEQDREIWTNVLMNPNGKVLFGKTVSNRASKFIAHLGGVKLTDDERAALISHIAGEGEHGRKLPDPIL